MVILRGIFRAHQAFLYIVPQEVPRYFLALHKLNFSFFAEIITKGTNLEVISHPKEAAQ